MMLYSMRCAVLQCAAIFMRFLFKSGMSQNANDPHTFRKQYLASSSQDLHDNVGSHHSKEDDEKAGFDGDPEPLIHLWMTTPNL